MRVILLSAARLTDFRRRVVETLLADESVHVLACAVDARPRRTMRTTLLRNLRHGRGGYVAVMAVKGLIRRRRQAATATTEQLMGEHEITTLLLDDPGHPDQAQQLSGLAPDALVLISGFGIIKEPILSLAPHGVLAYHHGDLRRYRGMPPAFWELYNDETEIGVTVQRLSPGLDDGAPVVEKRFAIGRQDTLTDVKQRLYDGSIGMMCDALHAAARASEAPARLASYGDIYTLPNLRQWLRFQIKMARRRWLASP